MIIEIDARQLQPPEPFERVVSALERAGPGDEIVLLLNRVPQPLFTFLERNGYRFEVAHDADSTVRTRIFQD
jgi:uncharacterized protein (DUF2249 family)